MRFLFVVTIILQLAQYANAQYLTQYQHYYTPISGQALTVTREHNVRQRNRDRQVLRNVAGLTWNNDGR